jgi:DnaJ-class molecular chaperone
MPVQKMTKCPVCHGAGRTSAGKLCKRCRGTGEINVLSKKGRAQIYLPASGAGKTAEPPVRN